MTQEKWNHNSGVPILPIHSAVWSMSKSIEKILYSWDAEKMYVPMLGQKKEKSLKNIFDYLVLHFFKYFITVYYFTSN